MSFNIKELENGVLVCYNDAEGKYCETAFVDDKDTYPQDAKDFVTSKKGIMADSMEKRAHQRIDNFVNKETTRE